MVDEYDNKIVYEGLAKDVQIPLWSMNTNDHLSFNFLKHVQIPLWSMNTVNIFRFA